MKIAFRASPRPGAQGALHELSSRYGQTPAAEADFIVTLGGDGTALEALHETLAMPAKPVFAMRTDSSTGVLCNSLRVHGLIERLHAAARVELPVLQAEIEQAGGRSQVLFAINEIVLERQVFQQAKLSIAVRGNGDPMNINGDGLVLTTPIGSTGYNRTLGGAAATARIFAHGRHRQGHRVPSRLVSRCLERPRDLGCRGHRGRSPSRSNSDHL
ncbi:hypothetical protein [Sinorhizobium meliloti]